MRTPNKEQLKAIETVDGPVRIIAGPGTGKTETLVKRTIYLIEECEIKPENIFIATFTEKAAKELITRISDELSQRNIAMNLNEMYIGTFHSLCLRILREYTQSGKNYGTLDEFDQRYLVFQNMKKFENIQGVHSVLSPKGSMWKHAEEICQYVNILSEELITPEDLKADQNTDIAAVGDILETYQEILKEKNMLDFSSMQTETYKLLCNHKEILDELQSRITHIMIDEYQDTNYIQEQLVLLLAEKHKNICMVGDDDQALYRFRNATVRNILEFPQKFPPKECHEIELVTNYRSNSNIVDFYNNWMSNPVGFEWNGFRCPKTIEPHENTTLHSPAVVKLSSQNNEDEWHQKIFTFIKGLKDSGKITDYNQIAFLFRSVKNARVTALSRFLENHGINVYSPRSGMFFQREEIMLTIGCLLLMFPNYTRKLKKRKYVKKTPKYLKYYKECLLFVKDYLMKDTNLLRWIWDKGKFHSELTGTTDYAYRGLLYQLFKHRLFSKFLDTDVNAGVIDVQPVRNLAKFMQLIGKFEEMYGIDFLDAKESETHNGYRMIDLYTEHLFNQYFALLCNECIFEYEDESEYAPSGCVSFMTIHQSKGMEFPVVVVGSLWDWPWGQNNPVMRAIRRTYFKRHTYERNCYRKDFWRLYYTAFSRAQNLLVLTCNEDNNTPRCYFQPLYENLPSIENSNFNISEFSFEAVHNVNLKNSYSFTSHVSLYETCSRQYKFYKELGFQPARTRDMLLGTLVHETIEDVHRAVLRNKEDSISDENVRRWFNANCKSLARTRHVRLTGSQLNDALKQVLRYVAAQKSDWSRIKQAEVKLSVAESDYIVEGKIDLIRSDGDKVEIVDFKTERKPASVSRKYRRQLNIYAYLVEKCTGQRVSKMTLYYTGEDSENPTVTFDYNENVVNDTMASFDETVHKIMNKDFRECANNPGVCQRCDLRFYCARG